MKKCSKCGKLTEGNFCPDCGNNLELCKEIILCPNCGHEVDSHFCSNCGYNMVQNEKEHEGEVVGCGKNNEINIEKELYSLEEQAYVEEIVENTEVSLDDSNEFVQDAIVSDFNSNEVVKKRFHEKTWFVILMLVILFPVGVYFMWKHKKFNKVVRVIASVILGLNFAFWLLIAIALMIPCEHENTDTYTHTNATLTETGIEVEYCVDCDENLDSWETDKKEPYVYTDSFNFEDKEFIDWINEISTAEVEYEDLELFPENTSYRVTMPEGDKGALILHHDDYDDVDAIMIYFDEYESAVALATFIGSKIDSDFSADDAFPKLVLDKSYTSAGMTIARLNLEQDFEVTLLAPNEFVAELLE